jgi:4a-hydroxytetrahydrobiopterin dehydratase
MPESQIGNLAEQLPEWEIVERDGIKRLQRTFAFADFRRAMERTFAFADFRRAMEFAGDVGEVAEAQGHHPVLEVTWGRTTVTWYTHKLGGLHRNDFIMAAKTDELYSDRQG